MTLKTVYYAESWEKVYDAFEQVNFVAYDFQTIRDSIIDYIKFYYPEQFTDYIESSQLVAIIEAFAYVAEQMAYRIDMASHENFISTAARKQSILRLARLVSYKATRNVPARGLVKIYSVACTETIYDSQGNNLLNKTILWNDQNNPYWKEQFFLVMNRLLVNPIGQPSKTFQVNDVLFQLYTFNNTLDSFSYGVYPFSAVVGDITYPMEVVSSDIDEYGPFEKAPDVNSLMNVLYASDGLGDGSDTTGFLMYVKQGTLTRTDYNFDIRLTNNSVDLDIININEVDVWINKVDQDGRIIERWREVENINSQNLYFNGDKTKNKYELETLENDAIRIKFGDDNFANIPLGLFHIWTRSSANENIIIQKNKVQNEKMTFNYNSHLGGIIESAAMTFSLVSTLQNASASEDIEHIREAAPATYYSQNKMVDGQDYNTFLLKNPSIIRLKSINRTFAGQPKYVEWNDASGNYQNVKIFGDDLRIYVESLKDSMTTSVSSRNLIDSVIEPLLSSSGMVNMIGSMSYGVTSDLTDDVKIISQPRTKFFEFSYPVAKPNKMFKEKTSIQGLLDRHYYGEPLDRISINGIIYGLVDIPDPTNIDVELVKIYDSNLQLTADGVTPLNITAGNISGIQTTVQRQKKFGLKFNKTLPIFGNGSIEITNTVAKRAVQTWTIECINESDISEATFSVVGSIDGYKKTAIVGLDYESDGISFKIKTGSTPFKIGDSFIVIVDTTNTVEIKTVNLLGVWEIINESSLSKFDVNAKFDQMDPINSWLILIERNDDNKGNIINWSITYRDYRIVVESPTTKFWYNDINFIIDSNTKKKVRDTISILKSNASADNAGYLGKNQVYDVIGSVKYDNAEMNINALMVQPTDNSHTYRSGDDLPDNPLQLTSLIGKTDFVYFVKQDENSNFEPISGSDFVYRSIYVKNLDYDVLTDLATFGGKTYLRKHGREGLDFLWMHFSPHMNLIDPSTSNLIDIFVLTKGYYDNMMAYISGKSDVYPIPPTALELRNTYQDLLKSKMISDTAIMHSGKMKLLFGDLADPQLRAKFRIIKLPTATLTDDQIKSEMISIINDYFAVDNWDFGDTFYATQLISEIHAKMSTEIASVVLVPIYVNNYFGNLFIIESGDDEILQSAATINDIEIIETFNATNLKQKT